MKDTFGSHFKLTLFGESHGPAVGAVLDGLAPGLPVDTGYIAAEMDKRRAVGAISTPRKEADEVEFLSGVYNGYTTGTALCLVVRNTNTRSQDYSQMQTLLRPGHADYTGRVKYAGFADPRGGGHFSGRLTAPIVAAGAICRSILAGKGVHIGTHLLRCGGVQDASLPLGEPALTEALHSLNQKAFAVLDDGAGKRMQAAILQAKKEGDSVGGILETAVTGLPAGLGEPFFGSVESVLASLFFSIPGVKGVEFGLGFGFADKCGSEANDEFAAMQDEIYTLTNNNGGVNGGIANGMPMVMRAVVKPTPSISRAQQTVNLQTGEAATLNLNGRHDPCIVHRARAVADAMTAIGLTDLFCAQAGVAWQTEGADGGL